MQPDPYWMPNQVPQMPGGFASQFMYNTAVSHAQSQGLIPSGQPIFMGDSDPYTAMRNQQYVLQQQQMLQSMATDQAAQMSGFLQGSIRLAGRDVPPELARALDRTTSAMSPMIVASLAQSQQGRHALDVSAGGISAANIGMAMGSMGFNTSDPLTMASTMDPNASAAMAMLVTQGLRAAPTSIFGDSLGPRASRGFKGQQLGNIMSIMHQRGEMPVMNAALDIATDPMLAAAMQRGTVTDNDLLRLGMTNGGIEDRLYAAGMIDKEGTTSSLGRSVLDLRYDGDQPGIRSREDLINYRKDQGYADAARMAQTYKADELEISNLDDKEANAALSVQKPGDPITKTVFEKWMRLNGLEALFPEDVEVPAGKLELDSFDSRLLERMAAGGSSLGVKDAATAKDLQQALFAARKGDTAKLDETLYGRMTRDEKLRLASSVTGVGLEDITKQIASYDAEELRGYIAGENRADPFKTHVSAKASEVAATAYGSDDVMQKVASGNAQRVVNNVAARVASLSAVRDILKDEGLSATEKELFEVMDDLTNHSFNQLGGMEAERIVRQMDATASKLGYGVAEMRAVAEIGAQTAEAMGMERPMGMLLSQQMLGGKLTARQMGVNSAGIYGMANEDQMARAQGNLMAHAVQSQEGSFMLAVSRMARQPGVKIDTSTEEGRMISELIGDSRAGILAGESLKFMEGKSYSERVAIAAKVMGTTTDIVQSEMMNQVANEEEGFKSNINYAVTDQASRDYFQNILPGQIASHTTQYMGSLGISPGENQRALGMQIARSTSRALEQMPAGLLNDTKADGTRNKIIADQAYADIQQSAKDGMAGAQEFLDKYSNKEDAVNALMRTFNYTNARHREVADKGLEESAYMGGEEARRLALKNRQEANVTALYRSLTSDQQGPSNEVKRLIEMGQGGGESGATVLELMGAHFGHDLSGQTQKTLANIAARAADEQDVLAAKIHEATPGSGREQAVDAYNAALERVELEMRNVLENDPAAKSEMQKLQADAAGREAGAGRKTDEAVQAAKAEGGAPGSIEMSNVTIKINGDDVLINGRGNATSNGGLYDVAGS